ncbi:MAG TPA: 3-dehydroquinate synthase [Steroidobacteraceae bacterium]|nr:3-dehydroquinate synthase [Steroidobacteraceae bacterium]
MTGLAQDVETLKVELGNRSYPILIGEGLLRRGDLVREHIPAKDVLVVSNTTVAPLYLEALTASLGPKRIVEAILPDGESHKSLETLSRVLDVCVTNRFGRDSMVVALGGGVVGDIAGFAASCYQRGVACVQVPTTLLAQVDSSVGGKTGVNHPGGKNLIGAFHQPAAVLADTSTLSTLPPRELRAGLAEVIKYGLIRDAAFFDWLETNIERLLAAEPAALAQVIRRSCEIKAQIVGQDETEQGDRALLNLGHTFGHAIESATHYTRWLHGEAVGAGMLMAAAMSHESGLLPRGAVDRLRALLQKVGLPVLIEGVGPTAALEHMRIDKKVQGGRIRLVLLRAIGDSLVTGDYPQAALARTLEAYFR